MILAHENSYCPHCKMATLGPSCHWCAGTETVRFSPAETQRRYEAYRRFRAHGVTHADALELLDQTAVLAGTARAANNLAVRELASTSRVDLVHAERDLTRRPLRTAVPVAVAA